MAIWQFNPEEYEAKDFEIIPAGDHRVRINEVIEKKFSSGNKGFEVTLDVSGHDGKLWFYLVLDPSDSKKTNQRVGTFFESFGITDYDLSHYRGWIGKVGGVRVKHEEYNGSQTAKVAFCLNKKNQERLPEAKFSTTVNAIPVNANMQPVNVQEDDLPFN